MAKKKLPDVTPEEFSELMQDITKRLIIGGLIAVAVGLVVILLMYFYGNAQA